MTQAILWAMAGTGFTFFMTSMGSATVFFFKKEISASIQRIFLGFAAGVMIAASIWSLLIPAMEEAKSAGQPEWLAASGGFILGIAFLMLLDSVLPHLHPGAKEAEGLSANWKRTTMLMTAVTLHNIPEGMAVGVTLAGAMIGNAGITMAGALALSIGIAIQNFPEGAIISMPLKSEGVPKWKAFTYGTLSGIVEPIGAIITILLTNIVVPVLPYLLSFAAGAMIYVVVEELIPESQAGEHSNIGTIGVAIGFVIMMILDVALG